MATFYEDTMERRRMLPQALLGMQSTGGTLTQDVKPGQAAPVLTRSMELRRKIAELEGSQGQDDGGASMLNALAAQYAGESFSPIQAQYLKRASAMSPQSRMQSQIARLTREAEIADRMEGQQALQADRLAAQQQAEAERRAAAAERAAQADATRRELAAQRDETTRFLAAQTAQLRREAAANKEAKPPAPKDPTEDQGKAAGYAFRMDTALRQIADLTAKDPSAARPSYIPTLAGKIPGIGEIAQRELTPAQRQRVENAQLDALDAALTLSTGAAYTREQLKMISGAYFPQLGETDPRVIEDKRKRLEDLVEVARVRAGRAAMPRVPAAPAGNTPAAPAPSGGGGIPPGVDPKVWNVMTPEERALWKR